MQPPPRYPNPSPAGVTPRGSRADGALLRTGIRVMVSARSTLPAATSRASTRRSALARTSVASARIPASLPSTPPPLTASGASRSSHRCLPNPHPPPTAWVIRSAHPGTALAPPPRASAPPSPPPSRAAASAPGVTAACPTSCCRRQQAEARPSVQDAGFPHFPSHTTFVPSLPTQQVRPLFPEKAVCSPPWAYPRSTPLH
jgi:hypothetical protein